MKKTSKSILVWLLTLVMATLLAATGIAALAVDGDVSDPPATMPEEVEITKIEIVPETVEVPPTEEGGETTTKTTYYMQVTFNLPEGEFTGESNSITTGTGNKYLYYNYVAATQKIGNKNRFNAYAMISANVLKFKFNVQPDPVLNDVVTFVKGFNVLLSDGTTVHLEHTQKWKNTEEGWVNLTAQQKEKEQKLRLELQNEGKNSATAGPGFGLEFGKFVDIATGKTVVLDYNDSEWGHHVEVAEYILYKGKDGSTSLPGWFRYASAVRLGNDGSHTYVKGDEITFLKGLHFCRGGGGWPGSTAYADMQYDGYLDETITFRCTGSGWIVKSVGPMAVDSVNSIQEQDATMALPATYRFTVKFSNMVTDDELDGLEAVDAYAEHIYFGDKSVKTLNEEITGLVNDDDEPVKAVYLSASGTDITVTIVKASAIWDGTSTLALKVTNGFIADSENYTEADATYYYLADLAYWSKVQPYAVEQKEAIDIASVADFSIIDNGANGDITVTFTDKLAENPMLWYNCMPDYRKTLPGAFNPAQTDTLVSADAYFSFLSHVEIDGTTIAALYAGSGSPESKSSTYQCHIGASGDAKTLSLRAAISTWSGNEAITIVFKSGLKFASGNYLDHDITVKYTPGEPATTVYEVTATSVSLEVTDAEGAAGSSHAIKVGETLHVSAVVAPVAANNAEIAYVISDPTVVSIEDGVLTALSAGTATVKATYGSLESDVVTVTVAPVLTGIVAEKTTVALTVGGKEKIVIKPTPEGVELGDVTFASENDAIATVGQDGTVTAVAEGTVKITATCGTFTAEVTVTVTKATTPDPENPDPEKPDPEKPDPEKPDPEKKGGCGSAAAADFVLGGLALLAIAGGVLIARRRKA